MVDGKKRGWGGSPQGMVISESPADPGTTIAEPRKDEETANLANLANFLRVRYNAQRNDVSGKALPVEISWRAGGGGGRLASCTMTHSR